MPQGFKMNQNEQRLDEVAHGINPNVHGFVGFHDYSFGPDLAEELFHKVQKMQIYYVVY